MPSEAVSPLRIHKSTPSSSPSKMKSPSHQRALTEVSPMEMRRNSPSSNQLPKKLVNNDSSPSSPFGNNSRLFWQGRDALSPRPSKDGASANRDHSPSPQRRSSIENLKKASRVKNSTMFAREQLNEYDPTSSPIVERPLASGRPLSERLQHSTVFSSHSSDPSCRSSILESPGHKGHRRGESQSKIPLMSPSKTPGQPTDTASLQQSSGSPNKSSLMSTGRSNGSKMFDPETGIWSEDDEDITKTTPRPLRRHAKSVTFDTAPPQINEFEMVTPDPSSVASDSRQGSYDSADEFDDSFEHGSFDHDDSFDASLEDTDKTPVVLPEDWRHMSPEVANTSLADTFEDPFDGGEGSPAPNSNPASAEVGRGQSTRTDSRDSNGQPRPLPPVPGSTSPSKGRRLSAIGVTAAAERATNHHRALPTVPAASPFSKSDIVNIRSDALTLEERLRLMGLQDSSDFPPEHALPVADQENVDESELDDYQPPQISRESILRKVKSRTFNKSGFDHPTPDQSYADLDPDVPIPSREVSSNFDDDISEVYVKKDPEDETEVSVFEIPELHALQRSPSRMDDYERESSVIRHDITNTAIDDDDASHYSEDDVDQGTSPANLTEDEGPPTPRPAPVLSTGNSREEIQTKHKSLPALGSFDDDNFHLDLQTYMKSLTANESFDPDESIPKLDTVREFLQRTRTPEPPQSSSQNGQEIEETPSTPDSVIRHPIDTEPQQCASPSTPEEKLNAWGPESEARTSSSHVSTGSDPMATADQQESQKNAPAIPERSPKRMSMSVEPEESRAISALSLRRQPDTDAELPRPSSEGDAKPNRRQSFRMKLDLPESNVEDSLDFSLNKEFDRVIEAQKKGYLMRQNTKVVVASTRQFSDEKPPSVASSTDSQATNARAARSAGPSPRKTSAEQGKTWTTEPWNPKVRRRSIRKSAGAGGFKPVTGVAPPLPGMESNVAAGLDTLAENSFIGDDFEDGQERGRLFVKVVGVKDLELPLPKSEKTWFQLTLDNGVHEVTTAWLELNRSAAIGQEFELVVQNELEFQLTLQTDIAPPVEEVEPPPSPTRGHKSKSSLSRFLSPKKRKEADRQAKEEAEALEAAKRDKAAAAQRRREANPTAWDLLHDLVGPTGSFARSYVCLKNHEREAFGRPLMVDIPCFNEWAVEDATVNSSMKSKRGGEVRRPPYRIGKLTLQLLYVPKPKDATDDDMPKSMNACIRELKQAEEVRNKTWEGHLSQQGGDCPYWRRRFFRLNGTKLTAYHEATHQPRATINLAKASKLIDDRSQLTQSQAPAKNGGRRKSAFAEEDGGYMFVEEGFRIRFANGETIDFYADTTASKEEWMKALVDVVGKTLGAGDGKGKGGWTDMVLTRERADRAASQVQGMQTSRPATKTGPPAASARYRAGTTSAPVSPMKNAGGNRPAGVAPPSPTRASPTKPSPAKKSPTRPLSPLKSHSPTRPASPVRKQIPSRPASPSKRGTATADKPLPQLREQKDQSKVTRRQQVRSMIF